jgi:hypothetical protein
VELDEEGRPRKATGRKKKAARKPAGRTTRKAPVRKKVSVTPKEAAEQAHAADSESIVTDDQGEAEDLAVEAGGATGEAAAEEKTSARKTARKLAEKKTGTPRTAADDASDETEE